jgi:hypothetical protein
VFNGKESARPITFKGKNQMVFGVKELENGFALNRRELRLEVQG